MKISLALYEKKTLNELQAYQAYKEDLTLILGFKEVSRFFEFSKEECITYAKELKASGFKVFLQWDILMTEETFGSLFHTLKNTEIFNTDIFDGLRVQDPGLLYALKELNYGGDVHFICEQGNHNLIGLKSWIKVWPEGIKRLVVSPQLPAQVLKSYADVLHEEYNVTLEVLGLGPLLLFYTPRKLVSPLYGEERETFKVAGTSEESPHKGFPIIENIHGTFMLNTKDQFIFDELFNKEQALKDHKGLCWRIDAICGLGNVSFEQMAELLSEAQPSVAMLKESYGRSVTKGFFRVNKTDVLFKKLKNHRLQERDESFVGEVVDVKKKNHVAVLVKSEKGLELGESLRLLSPEGREKFVTVEKMTNALSSNVSLAQKGDIVLIPPLGGISVRSMVYRA